MQVIAFLNPELRFTFAFLWCQQSWLDKHKTTFGFQPLKTGQIGHIEISISLEPNHTGPFKMNIPKEKFLS